MVRSNLTDIAISAMVASPVMIVLARIWPDLAWLVGLVLIAGGILILVHAYKRECGWPQYVVGVATAIFGLATEFATLDQLVWMAAFAIVSDFVIKEIDKHL